MPEPVIGIFDDLDAVRFARYRATIQFVDRVAGATPMNPEVIQAWIKKKTGLIDDQELMKIYWRTLEELGLPRDLAKEDLEQMSQTDREKVESLGDEAVKKIAEERNSVGFKVSDEGPYLESRVFKSMLRENVNILWPKERLGETRKGARNFFNERVFVDPVCVQFEGRKEPDGMFLFIGHTNGPQGPQSNLTWVQYLDQPTMTFDIKVLMDRGRAEKDKDRLVPSLPEDWWPSLFIAAQENGIGGMRSQGFGRFKVIRFERLPMVHNHWSDYLKLVRQMTFDDSAEPQTFEPGQGRIVGAVA